MLKGLVNLEASGSDAVLPFALPLCAFSPKSKVKSQHAPDPLTIIFALQEDMGKTVLFRQNVGSPLLSPKRVRMCAANWRSPSRLGESQRQIALDLREHRSAFNSPCLSKWFGFLERVPPKDPVVGQEAKHRNTQQRARNMVWAGACMVATETRSRGLMTIPTIPNQIRCK